MSDHAVSPGTTGQEDPDPFDSIIGEASSTTFGSGFTTTFRGYDKDEVDAAIAGLDARVRAAADEVAQLKQHQRRAGAALQRALDRTSPASAGPCPGHLLRHLPRPPSDRRAPGG